MKILGTLVGIVLFVAGFGLIVHGAVLPLGEHTGELNILEAVIGGCCC
jgi:hypothetical protein